MSQGRSARLAPPPAPPAAEPPARRPVVLATMGVPVSPAGERMAIETALATVYQLMTGDIAHPSDVVARDMNRWLERNKHLARR